MGDKEKDKKTGVSSPNGAKDLDRIIYQYLRKIRNASIRSYRSVIGQNGRRQKNVGTKSSTTEQETIHIGSEDVQEQDQIVQNLNSREKPTLETGSYSRQGTESELLFSLEKEGPEDSVSGPSEYTYLYDFQPNSQHMNLKMEEINQKLQNMRTTNGVLPFLIYAKKQQYILHVPCCQLYKSNFLKRILELGVSVASPVLVKTKLDICVNAQEDKSVKLTLPKVRIHFEAAAVDELKKHALNCDSSSSSSGAEVVCKYVEEQLNQIISEYSEISEVVDDSESGGMSGTMFGGANANQKKKVYRKRLGVYPQYRIRLNGVPWQTVDSSDEDTDDESAVLQRGLRKSQNKKDKALNVSTGTPSTSCEEGDGEESDLAMDIHVVSSTKRKAFIKRKRHYDEIDTTFSEASDVESLTDCSLCLSDSLP